MYIINEISERIFWDIKKMGRFMVTTAVNTKDM